MAGFGAFGKIAAEGDFLRIDVSQGFVEPWDRWLQGGIVSVREHLGAEWNSRFMTAPLWRFTLSPDVAGSAPALGVLMPSVDRVGRQFPLTLVAPLASGPNALRIHFEAERAFEALELIALDTLLDGVSRDVLAENLRKLEPFIPPGMAELRERPGLMTLFAAGADSVTPALAAQLGAGGFRAPSVWSTCIDDGSRLMISEGLPSVDMMAGFFDLTAPVWQMAASESAQA